MTCLPLVAMAVVGCGQPSEDDAAPLLTPDISPRCETPGLIGCSEDSKSVIECRMNSGGTLVWATKAPCGPFGACTEGVCGCVNQCDTMDARRCAETSIERCRADSFGCLYWEEDTRCADMGKTCDAQGGGATCVGGCDVEEASRCAGDVVQECTQNAQGYLDWLDAVSCAENNQVCRVTSGVAECVDP